MKTIRKCLVCGIEFATNNQYQKYCSTKCKKLHDVEAQRQKRQETPTIIESRKCKVCGVEFVPKYNSEKCCSQKCRLANKKALNEAWREKHGKKPKMKLNPYELTAAQIEQRERLKLELLRRRLLREGVQSYV